MYIWGTDIFKTVTARQMDKQTKEKTGKQMDE